MELQGISEPEDREKFGSGETGKSSSDVGESSSEKKGQLITDDYRQCVTGKLPASPDFSKLPCLTWVKILSYLNQEERLAVANTCTTLRQYCLSECCLWSSLNLHVGWEEESEWGKPSEVKLNEIEKQVLQISRGKIQYVDMGFYNFEDLEFDAESFECIAEASRTWPLKFLDFHPDLCCDSCFQHEFGSCPNSQLPSLYKQILINCLTSENVSRLETLGIFTNWWSDTRGSPEAFVIMMDSPFSHSLKHLILDWMYDVPLRSLTKNHMSALCSTVGRFINLQELKIPSAFLTNQLLEAQSQPGRAGLQTFSLLCGTFPEQLSTWPLLLASSPSLSVFVWSNETVECDSISPALPAIVPIIYWDVLETNLSNSSYLKVQRQLLQLLTLYAEHLIFLRVSDENLKGSDEDILSLVKVCPKLRILLFSGQISSDVILEIVALQKQWKELYFVDTTITFPQTWEGNREENLARLNSEVSKRLGYPWDCSQRAEVDEECILDTKDRGVMLKVEPEHVGLIWQFEKITGIE